jgi:hypothetical protein
MADVPLGIDIGTSTRHDREECNDRDVDPGTELGW